jgi:hypothetical protein
LGSTIFCEDEKAPPELDSPHMSLDHSFKGGHMATKKKAAKKKAGKTPVTKASSLVLKFDPRIKGDPPPPWVRLLDAVKAKQLEKWVNAVVKKVGR